MGNCADKEKAPKQSFHGVASTVADTNASHPPGIPRNQINDYRPEPMRSNSRFGSEISAESQQIFAGHRLNSAHHPSFNPQAFGVKNGSTHLNHGQQNGHSVAELSSNMSNSTSTFISSSHSNQVVSPVLVTSSNSSNLQSPKVQSSVSSSSSIIVTPSPIIASHSRKGQIVIALYNYQGSEHGDMTFSKGDLMEIVDDSDPDWWLARHVSRENCTGHIPRNYVAFQSSIESQDWYFGSISRYQAEELLSNPGNPRGTFLIRLSSSQQNPGGYALSIEDKISGSNTTQQPSSNGTGSGGQQQIKHYKIKLLDNNRGFYITTRQTFQTLHDLVCGYSSPTAKGLCCTLTLPCPRIGGPSDTKNNALEYATRDQYEISRDTIQLSKKLGAGNFGEVWKGSWQGRIDVAVKTLKPNTMSQEAFLQEAEIMKKFSHPHLVSMYAVCTEKEPFFIITEFMSRGALLDNLRMDSSNRLTFDNLISISGQVALGMAHLERKALIHRDLAARNVLIGENLITKVADFGLARVIVNDNEYSAQQGARFPVKWTSPEAIAFGKFSVKSDIWSYGVLLMETFTYGQLPYPGMNNREVIDQVERGYRMPQPTQVSYPESRRNGREIALAQTNVYKIMIECWNRDPVKRPTFEFLAHLFEDFNVSTQGQYVE